MKNILQLIFITTIISIAISISYAIEKRSYFYEEVDVYKLITNEINNKYPIEEDKNKIQASKEIVKKYWKLSYDKRYLLFSDSYKNNLKKYYGIVDAKSYLNHFTTSEKVWFKQTYEGYEIINDKSLRIIVLAEWSEDGIEGKRYYYFVMYFNSNLNAWEISDIYY